MENPGRHIGVRRLEPAPKPGRGPLLALALGVTVALVAWGYLVYLAIDFGTAARGGGSHAWLLLALATAGAIGCLFVGLLLVVRLLDGFRTQKLPTKAPDVLAPRPSVVRSPRAGTRALDRSEIRADGGRSTPRTPGGRRAAR
ncbi:MAG: hypothetical protein ACR2K3_00240 [Nocardioides sp.]